MKITTGEVVYRPVSYFSNLIRVIPFKPLIHIIILKKTVQANQDYFGSSVSGITKTGLRKRLMNIDDTYYHLVKIVGKKF